MFKLTKIMEILLVTACTQVFLQFKHSYGWIYELFLSSGANNVQERFEQVGTTVITKVNIFKKNCTWEVHAITFSYKNLKKEKNLYNC